MELKAKIEAALQYLRDTDLAAMAPGRYEINDDFFILRQSYNSKPDEMCKFETHRKYVDIQWIISGKEAIEATILEGCEVTEPYDADKDAEFYAKPDKAVSRVVVSEGCYMTLFPEIVHRAGLAEGESVPVEKVVGKVRI